VNMLKGDITAQSFSQCQQDLAVSELFDGCGRFLDIGSRDPKVDSNSLLLEKMGWDGVCIDAVRFDYSNRKAKFIQGDALEILAGSDMTGQRFDYASLDIDGSTTEAVNVVIGNGIKFLFATVEHDKYLHGGRCQHFQHRALSAAGYVPMFIDILPHGSGDMYFEDWWCDRSLCDKTLGFGLSPLEALEEIKQRSKFLLTGKDI